MSIRLSSLPIQVERMDEISPGQFILYGATWVNEFGPFKTGERTPKIVLNYIKGEMQEYINGEAFANKDGFYLKPGKIIKFKYNII